MDDFHAAVERQRQKCNEERRLKQRMKELERGNQQPLRPQSGDPTQRDRGPLENKKDNASFSRNVEQPYAKLKPAKKSRKSGAGESAGEVPAVSLFVGEQLVAPAKKRKLSELEKAPEKQSCGTVNAAPTSVETNPIKWGPSKKPARKAAPAEQFEYEVVDTSQAQADKLQDWYKNINMKSKYFRKDVQDLSYIRELIKKCYEARSKGEFVELHVSNLRQRLHQTEFFGFLNNANIATIGVTIKKSRILEAEGLPEIFNNTHRVFPPDVVSDAATLWSRWITGDFDPNLVRGVQISRAVLNGKKRISYKLKDISDFPQRRSAHVVGENGLRVGHWWPIRVCAIRDGAHGETEAGISGQTGRGVFAICLAEGGYHDEDNGTSIEYCGTASDNSTPSRHTQQMISTAAMDPKQPIRVLRAVNKKSKYAPSVGIRYDGLYEIVGYELKDESTAMYRFSLRRKPDQDPIRWGDKSDSRPTPDEKNALRAIKDLIGVTVA